MQATFTFQADSRADLDALMDFFGRYFGQPAMFNALEGLGPPLMTNDEQPVPMMTEAPSVFDLPTATPEPEAPKKKRGRPKKEDPNQHVLLPVDEETQDAAADVFDTLFGDNAKPALDPTELKTMTPEEQRSKGTQLLLDLIERDPNRKGEVRKLVEKFGVKQFSLIPDARSAEFFADVLMLDHAAEQ